MENIPNNIDELLQRIAALEYTIAILRDENRLLREQLDHPQRTNARQAAPFRQHPNKKIPEEEKKRPGRKPDHPGECRAVPTQIHQEIEQPFI
jgi:hypothetical protein